DVSDASASRLLINLGYCEIGLGEPEKAEEYLLKAKRLIDKNVTVNAFDAADCLMALGECHYMQGQAKKALREYSEALSFYEQKLGASSAELVPTLEGIAGGYDAEGQFNDSLRVFKRIARIDLEAFGPESPRLGMAFNNLCDAYSKVDDCSNARKFFEQVIWIFRKTNHDRLLAEIDRKAQEGSYSKDAIEKMKARVKDAIMGSITPPDIGAASSALLKSVEDSAEVSAAGNQRAAIVRSDDFENWRIKHRPDDEIFFSRIDPQVEQKGMIVCLHGLGLHAGSYEDFATKVNPMGYGVFALDVRGFGSLAF